MLLVVFLKFHVMLKLSFSTIKHGKMEAASTNANGMLQYRLYDCIRKVVSEQKDSLKDLH
jgi:hypothetical protein